MAVGVSAVAGEVPPTSGRRSALGPITLRREQLSRLPRRCVLSGLPADTTAAFAATSKVMSWWWLVLVPFGPPAWLVIAIVYGLRRAANRQRVTLPVAAAAYDAHNHLVRLVRLAATAVLVYAVAGAAATWGLDPGPARTVIQVAAALVASVSLLIVYVRRSRTTRVRLVDGDVVIHNAHRAFTDELR